MSTIRCLTVLFVLSALALPGAAWAHGSGPPVSASIHLQPNDEQTMLIGTASSHGLLISRDGGASFRWVCEDAIGYGGLYEPTYAISTAGTFFATTYRGLSASRDGGCTWHNVGGPLHEDIWAQDIDLGPQDQLWVVTGVFNVANKVFVSTDDGRTFLAKNLELTDGLWYSILAAPSDSQRVYVTGYTIAGPSDMPPAQPLLYRTDNGGDTWSALPPDPTAVPLGKPPVFELMAISPANPDMVFAAARTTVASGSGDELYRSADGGTTWTKVLETQTRIGNVLIRQSGDIVVGVRTQGVYVSTDGGETFATNLATPIMACATETASGDILACGANWEPDLFAIGRSRDLMTWEPVLRFAQVTAPLSCPAETVQYETCEVYQWDTQCILFGCPSAQPDAGTGGDASTWADAGQPAAGSGGCCSASGQPGPGPGPGQLVLWLLAALGLMRVFRGTEPSASACSGHIRILHRKHHGSAGTVARAVDCALLRPRGRRG